MFLPSLPLPPPRQIISTKRETRERKRTRYGRKKRKQTTGGIWRAFLRRMIGTLSQLGQENPLHPGKKKEGKTSSTQKTAVSGSELLLSLFCVHSVPLLHGSSAGKTQPFLGWFMLKSLKSNNEVIFGESFKTFNRPILTEAVEMFQILGRLTRASDQSSRIVKLISVDRGRIS